MPRLKSSEWLSTTGVAELLYVHPNTVRRWTAQGRIPVYRMGVGLGQRRYKLTDVVMFKHAEDSKT